MKASHLALKSVALCMFLTLLGAIAKRSEAGEPYSNNVIRIGILNDQAGPYSGISGRGSIVAAEMATEEFDRSIDGVSVEIISADHQNRPDIAVGIVRKWFDVDNVDAIADISSSGVGFAVVALAKERKKVVLNASASSDFTGKACTDLSTQWVYNTYSNGYTLARTLTEQGQNTWFLVTVDYVFGQSFSADVRKGVKDAGGTVLGEVRHPLNTSDFSSYLLQAQSSGAKVIALLSAGGDMLNATKQANEFQIGKSQTVVSPIVYLSDVHSMGLQTAEGLEFITAFYWNRDEAARTWSKKFFERAGRMPTMAHAGMYSAVRHYLRAVSLVKSDDPYAVLAKMRELPITDAFAQKGTLRADGQMVHDMYLVRVKKPSEQKIPWDYYDILSTIPGDEAFRPLEQSECPIRAN
jgi:branched-chain amino acid transport system substrate-binding protein